MTIEKNTNEEIERDRAWKWFKRGFEQSAEGFNAEFGYNWEERIAEEFHEMWDENE